MDTTTQCLWLLWCEPFRKSCWYCFQETKRYIYRCCCKPKPQNNLSQRNRRNRNKNQNISPISPSPSSTSNSSWFFKLFGYNDKDSSNNNNTDLIYDQVGTELSSMESSEIHDAPDLKKKVSLGDLYGSRSSRFYGSDISDIDKSLSNHFTSINSHHGLNNSSQKVNDDEEKAHTQTKKVFLGELYGSQSSRLYGDKNSQPEKINSSLNENNSLNSHQQSFPLHQMSSTSSSYILSLNNNNNTHNPILDTNTNTNINTNLNIATSSFSKVGNDLVEIESEVGLGIGKPKKQSLGELYSSQSSKYYGKQPYSSNSP